MTSTREDALGAALVFASVGSGKNGKGGPPPAFIGWFFMAIAGAFSDPIEARHFRLRWYPSVEAGASKRRGQSSRRLIQARGLTATEPFAHPC